MVNTNTYICTSKVIYDGSLHMLIIHMSIHVSMHCHICNPCSGMANYSMQWHLMLKVH